MLIQQTFHTVILLMQRAHIEMISSLDPRRPGFEFDDKMFDIICRGAIGGKTGKTAVLPGFCKIERSSSGVLLCYRGLILLGHVCRSGGAPESTKFFLKKSRYNIIKIEKRHLEKRHIHEKKPMQPQNIFHLSLQSLALQ